MTIYAEMKDGKKVYYTKGSKGKKVYGTLPIGRPLRGGRVPNGVYGRFISPSYNTKNANGIMFAGASQGKNKVDKNRKPRKNRSIKARTHLKK